MNQTILKPGDAGYSLADDYAPLDRKYYKVGDKLAVFDQLRVAAAFRRLDDIPMMRESLRIGGYNVAELTDEIVLQVGHRVRLGLVTCTPEEKRASEEFLRFRNLM